MGKAAAPPNANKMVPKPRKNDLNEGASYVAFCMLADESPIIVTINKMIPISVVPMAPYAAGQKSSGEPNHDKGNKMSATIGTHSQNEIFLMNEWLNEDTNSEHRRR